MEGETFSQDFHGRIDGDWGVKYVAEFFKEMQHNFDCFLSFSFDSIYAEDYTVLYFTSV